MSLPDKTILIASSSLDETAWKPVAGRLDARGYEVIAYEADKVATGETGLDVRVDQSGLNVQYDPSMV
jgi:hypothetical protein